MTSYFFVFTLIQSLGRDVISQVAYHDFKSYILRSLRLSRMTTIIRMLRKSWLLRHSVLLLHNFTVIFFFSLLLIVANRGVVRKSSNKCYVIRFRDTHPYVIVAAIFFVVHNNHLTGRRKKIRKKRVKRRGELVRRRVRSV